MTMKRAVLATALGAGLVAFVASSVAAGQAKPAPAAPAKFVAAVKGIAEISVMPPASKVDQKSNEVITTIRLRNGANGAIAGLKVEEYWWDKASNPVTGSSYRHPKPLLPGESITVTLKTPKDPKMFRNTYQFSHANGQIRAKNVKKLE